MDEEHASGHQNEQHENKNEGISWIGIIIRFIVAAIVLMITAFLVPGFSQITFGTALVAALVIAALDYILVRFLNLDAAPFGRGITGFIVAAIVIYLTQFIVPGMQVTMLGAIIAALVIGLIDMVIPTKVM